MPKTLGSWHFIVLRAEGPCEAAIITTSNSRKLTTQNIHLVDGNLLRNRAIIDLADVFPYLPSLLDYNMLSMVIAGVYSLACTASYNLLLKLNTSVV